MGLIADRLAQSLKHRCALVGVGNRLRGDDGFGPLVIDLLAGKTSLQLFDVGSNPENYLGPITDAAPEEVILIDAIAFDAPVGSLHWLEPDDLLAAGTSTHAPSFDMFVSYMAQSIAAQTHILGVVPAQMQITAEISGPVRTAADRLASLITALSPPVAPDPCPNTPASCTNCP